MFTGLVESLGRVVVIRSLNPGKRIEIENSGLFQSATVGDSICINGCCLTVISLSKTSSAFEAGPETLAKTNLGELRVGDRVNLERALSPTGRLGGHIVQGHVDGTARIASQQSAGPWQTVWFAAGSLALDLIPKGSVAVDGVSLTVVDVTNDSFSVALIPQTLAETTLGFKQVGDTVNIETDVIGKYVKRYIEQVSGGLTAETLRSAGFLQ